MKRNFLKNSLATFAFTMAIVASFAFAPAQGDDAGQEYYFDVLTQKCETTPETCDNTTSKICTVGHVGIDNGGVQVWDVRNITGTICSEELYHSEEPDPEL